MRKDFKKTPTVPEILIRNDDEKQYLISSLPMSTSPQNLLEIYNSNLQLPIEIHLL